MAAVGGTRERQTQGRSPFLPCRRSFLFPSAEGSVARRRILPRKSAPVRRKLLSFRREVPERTHLDGRRPDAWETRCPRRAGSRLQLPQGAPLPPVWTSSCALHCRPLPYHRHRALSPLPTHPGLAKLTTLPEPVCACAWGKRLANSTREASVCCAHDVRPAPTGRSPLV